MDTEASMSDGSVAGTGQGSGEEHIRFEKARPDRTDESEGVGQADVFGASDEGDGAEGGPDGVPLI